MKALLHPLKQTRSEEIETKPLNSPIPFGTYVDTFFELISEIFSRAYTKVYSGYWNDGLEQRMRRDYTSTDWNNCIYETYVPVAAVEDQNMSFFRIVMKVVPEISQKEAKELSVDLMRPLEKPVGVIDSELIVLVAPRRKGYTHGFKHVPMRGHLTAIIINRNAIEVVKKLSRIIYKFIEKRMDALLEKFGIQRDCKAHEVYYKKKGSFYYIKYINNRRVNFPLHLHIIKTIRCLSHFLDWMVQRLRRLEAKNEAVEKIVSAAFSVGNVEERLTCLEEAKRRIIKMYNERETRRTLRLLEAYAKCKGDGDASK